MLTIKYGPQKTQALVEHFIVNEVINRVEYLKENNIENYRTVGYYSLTHWAGCPNTVQCPYVAKLVLDVFPEEIIEAYKNQLAQA